LTAANGNKMGIPKPYIMVIKTTLSALEYLNYKAYSAPPYVDLKDDIEVA
jgi:hypothetical protein